MKTLRAHLALGAWVALLLVVLGGCGASQREKTLRATLIATNAARDGFTTFNAEHQQKIVADAKTLEEGKAALAAYREARERVLAAFELVYQSIAAALLLDDKAPLTDLFKAAEDLKTRLAEVRK